MNSQTSIRAFKYVPSAGSADVNLTLVGNGVGWKSERPSPIGCKNDCMVEDRGYDGKTYFFKHDGRKPRQLSFEDIRGTR
jgi:hypothetical protein